MSPLARSENPAAEPGPRIALIGLTSWDRLLVIDRHPNPGDQSIVLDEFEGPGGTTTNTAMQLARLGATVTLATAVGDDEAGGRVQRLLADAEIRTPDLVVRPGARTDLATVLVSQEPPDRTILWREGAQLRRGDKLDIADLFDHDLVVLDFTDLPLLRFLTDLPAHTSPRARLLGTINYLADPAIPDRLELALRHDAIVAGEKDLRLLTGDNDAETAIDRLQRAMIGANLRAAVVTRGARGCVVLTETTREAFAAYPIAAVDPTGAGDAFAAGIAHGMALRWDWPKSARFAGALGALATRALGAQSSLASLSEVVAFMALHEHR